MFDHFIDSRFARRRRWPSMLLGIALVAALGIGTGIALRSSAKSPEDCEEAPELSRLKPPSPALRLAAPPPPPPPPPPARTKAGQAAMGADKGADRRTPTSERERPEEAPPSSPPVCDEDSARARILAGDDLYRAGKYSEAVEAYEAGLDKAPELAIGHHNAGLAYLELFKAGSGGEEDKRYAKKASEHFETYLESRPDDPKIKSLVSKTWMDAELYDRALRYWEQELENAPDKQSIMLKLAAICRKAGRFESAVEWHERRAEILSEPDAKVDALMDIGKLEFSRLRESDLVGRARLEVADRGIAALQKAEKLGTDDAMIQALLASMYQLRAHAHGASWSRTIDRASSRIHHRKAAELR